MSTTATRKKSTTRRSRPAQQPVLLAKGTPTARRKKARRRSSFSRKKDILAQVPAAWRVGLRTLRNVRLRKAWIGRAWERSRSFLALAALGALIVLDPAFLFSLLVLAVLASLSLMALSMIAAVILALSILRRVAPRYFATIPIHATELKTA